MRFPPPSGREHLSLSLSKSSFSVEVAFCFQDTFFFLLGCVYSSKYVEARVRLASSPFVFVTSGRSCNSRVHVRAHGSHVDAGTNDWMQNHVYLSRMEHRVE